jgi:hypothetical protein
MVHGERGTCEPSWNVQAVGPVLLAVQGEVDDLMKRTILDETGGISCQQRSPTDDGQLGFGMLQMENTVEVQTVSGQTQVMKLVVKRLKPSTVSCLVVHPKQFDS